MTKANKIIITLTAVSILIAIVFGLVQYSKHSKKTQSTQGDSNIQIIGDHNYVDNRTYILKLGVNSKLTYSFSRLEHSKDEKYTRKLILAVEGDIPVYNPEVYLRFNKVIQKVEGKGGCALLMVSIKGASNSNEYIFSAREFPPGFTREFLFSNKTEFDILEFRINDKKIFWSNNQNIG